MSTQRNIQKTRHISSAPAATTHRKHVHFREIHSAANSPTNSLPSAIQHGQLALVDSANSSLPSNSHTLSQSSASTSSTPKSGSFYRLPDDLLARGDFIAYQGGNVRDFYNTTHHTRAKRVSEICLVNDHYILVQIPAAQMEHVGAMDTISEEAGSASADCAQRKGFLRYFPCHRSRRVLPLTTASKVKVDEPKNVYADKKHSILKCPMAHCWRVNETPPEVFETRTKMCGEFWKQKTPGKVITIQPSKVDIAEPLDLRNNTARNPANGLSTPEYDSKVATGAFGSPVNSPVKPPLFGGALQTSLHDTVALEQHAAWLNNADLDMSKAVLGKHNNKSALESKTAKTKRRANVLRWFFKRARAAKPKTKLHAVVYKTYFVRWKKPPDDTCPHCGHSRDDDEVSAVATCKWRRCRSATF